MLKEVQRTRTVKVKMIPISEGDWKLLKLTRTQVNFPVRKCLWRTWENQVF